jgi:hypothetical protein
MLSLLRRIRKGCFGLTSYNQEKLFDGNRGRHCTLHHQVYNLSDGGGMFDIKYGHYICFLPLSLTPVTLRLWEDVHVACTYTIAIKVTCKKCCSPGENVQTLKS